MRALLLLLASACVTPPPVAHPDLDAMSTDNAGCSKQAPKVPTDLPGAADWCLELKVPTGIRWWYSAPQFNLLLDATGKVLYRSVLEKRRTHRIADPRAADLDHDGVDELLYQRTGTDASGVTLVHLEVVSFQDPADPHADQIQIAGATGSDRCQATWKLVAREDGGSDILVSGDCEKGAQAITYRLQGANLERQP